MDKNDYDENYVDHNIKGSEPDRKNKALVIVLAAVAFLLLVIIFLLSPLKEMIFPAQSEQDTTMEDDTGVLPDERESDDYEYSDTSLDDSESSGETEAPLVVNRPPVIEEFIIGPIDVMEAVRSGEAIPITFVEQPLYFTVLASDPEDEVIDFEIVVSHGVIHDSGRPDDNTIQFIWVSPPNSEGLIDTTVNATVEVTAVDFSGGRDRAVINLAMTPESSAGGREPADPGGAFSVAQFYRVSATADLSGYINSAGDVRTGTIIIGDDDSNRQYKGYLTFDLEGIAEIAPDDITGAEIFFNHVNKSGEPQTVGEFVDYKVFNYGPTLDGSDFAVGGNRFMMIDTNSFTSGSTAKGSLVIQLRTILSAGGTTLQVKMGLDAVTNRNNAWDMFQFNPENVELLVDYLE